MPQLQLGRFAVSFSISNVILGAIGVLASVGGMSGQIIALNFWLNGFTTVDSPFTVLTLVAMTVAVVYSASLVGWIVVKRPRLHFALQPKCIVFGLACGFCYSLNGLLLVYATADTPELIQVMLISTGVFWTFLTASMVHLFQTGRQACKAVDRRALLVPLAFVMCAAGIVLGAGSFNLSSLTYDNKKWTIIFSIAQIPGAVFNVMSAQYMDLYTQPNEVSTPSTVTSRSQLQQVTPNAYQRPNPNQSDPTTVKLVLLAVSAVGQAICLWCYFPLNWVDGFGSDPDYATARANLSLNYKCVFFACPASTNFWYFVAFAVSYAATLVGSAILNHFSAPMCSMVTQIATPIADLLLVIFPVLNVDKQPYNVGDVIGALILITAGSVLYVVWSRFLQPQAIVVPLDERYTAEPLYPEDQNAYGGFTPDAKCPKDLEEY